MAAGGFRAAEALSIRIRDLVAYHLNCFDLVSLNHLNRNKNSN
jgi:hypothetical protein